MIKRIRTASLLPFFRFDHPLVIIHRYDISCVLQQNDKVIETIVIDRSPII